MSSIDRQRVATVRKPERMGIASAGSQPTNDPAALLAAADMLHALLVKRAVEITELLAGSVECSEEQRELAAIIEAIEAYKKVRWPNGGADSSRG
jgi:hypothetical protein